MNVLMAYATKNGSTQQVADAVAAALCEIPARVGGKAAVGGADNHVLPVGEELQQHTAREA